MRYNQAPCNLLLDKLTHNHLDVRAQEMLQHNSLYTVQLTVYYCLLMRSAMFHKHMQGLYLNAFKRSHNPAAAKLRQFDCNSI